MSEIRWTADTGYFLADCMLKAIASVDVGSTRDRGEVQKTEDAAS